MAGASDVAFPAAVRAYAAEVTGCADGDVTAVARFPDGNRHAVFKVTHLDGSGVARDAVVRVCLGGDRAQQDQAAHEARVLAKVGGGAGPLLYDFRPAGPWFATPAMCMQFVPGDQRDLGSAPAADIERLGSIVGWVHTRPVDDLADPAGAARLASYADGRLRSILATTTWIRAPLPTSARRRLRRAADAVQQSAPAGDGFGVGEGLVLLHGDVGPGNVLWGAGPVLIDWEYARVGDPADEIAYLFDQNALTDAQRDAFWRGYRDQRGGSQMARVAQRVGWWEPVTLLGSALWWAQRWVRRLEADAAGAPDPEASREAGYYADHVLRRLDRLEAMLGRRR